MKASIRFILVAITACSALMLMGCGNSSSAPANRPVAVSTGGSVGTAPPLPSNAGTALNPVTGIPQQSLQAMLGTYTGTLTQNGPNTDYQSVTQSYSFGLGVGQAQGASYLYVNFSSGNMSASTYLSLVPGAYGQIGPNPSGGTTASFEAGYTFISPVLNAPSISAYPIAIEVTVALINGTQVDPAQSKIRILDCGLSQSAACSTDLDSLLIGSISGKS